jgi:glycosyltransferase involved in cell wall biosynthesis
VTEILLLASMAPLHATLAEAVEKFHQRGAVVRLAGMTPVSRTHADIGLDDVRSLHLEAEGRSPAFWRMHFASNSPVRTWLHVRNDDWTLEHAARADLLVALDNQGLLSIWHLARRNKAAAARIGLGPALRALDELSAGDRRQRPDAPAAQPARDQVTEDGRPTWRRAMLTLAARRLASSPSPTRTERRLLRVGPLASRTRVELGTAVMESALVSGAADTAREVAAGLGGALQRADFLGELVARDLDEGRTPALLVDAYSAELDYADELLGGGEHEQAAASFLQATRLAFHRAAHMDTVESPLAQNPAGFVAPLQQSQVFRRLTEQAGRGQGTSGPRRVSGRPTRVVLATMDNTHFLSEIRAQLERSEAFEVRAVDHNDYKRRFWVHQTPMLASELRHGSVRNRADDTFRPLLDWADVVLVDWCTPLAYAFTLVDPGSTRLMVRLHSFEAFTVWPHLMDFSRLDDIVFVSDHLRDFTLQAVPRLAASDLATHVLPNAVDLRRCVRPKPDEARFNLGLIGYSVVAKDPRWAVEVLCRLRGTDPRYRLLLVGHDLYAGPTAAARRYAESFRVDLDELEPSGAVRRIGHTDDLPSVLTEVGTILSTSVRESQHIGLLEGAASGAVPVVRDWPYFAALTEGPRTMFPDDWVVQSPKEAADRILWATEDVTRWRAIGAAASKEAIATWDITRHQADYRRVFAT